MRKWFILLVFVLVYTNGQGQLFWKISGGNTTKSSYLFGTHHLISPDFLQTIPDVNKKFNQCKTIVGEFVLCNSDYYQQMLNGAKLPEGVGLDSLFSNEDFNRINEELKLVMGIELGNLIKMKPQFVELLYQNALVRKELKCEDDLFLDSYFQVQGEVSGKKVIGLEGFEDQFKRLAFDRELNIQALSLLECVRNKDKNVQTIHQLTRFYQNQDLKGLYDLMVMQDGILGLSSENEIDCFVNKVNVAWSLKLDKILNEGSAFIAVGALHLPGENGLLNLLVKAGYKVVPVR